MPKEVFEIFLANLLQTRPEEYIAVFFGLLSVWYARKANILVYPTGIVSVLLYVYICLHAKLYADMGINFVYFVMSVYGWYFWTRKDAGQKLVPISWCTQRGRLFSLLGAALSFVVLYFVLSELTDSDVPLVDAFTTAVFLVGMFLMARKKVENWVAWIIGDLVSIPLYFYKDLVMTSFQYTIFLILAVSGYLEWKRAAQRG